MGQASATPDELITGMQMDREEFTRRWEKLPHLKNAELIEGTVFVSSPVSLLHGNNDLAIHAWLGAYQALTPGVDAGCHVTYYMLESAPQPDAMLRIRPEYGGNSGEHGIYGAGAPELIAEVCGSSTDPDFGPKLHLYHRAGVREYITADTLMRRLKWRALSKGSYRDLEPGPDGILRSVAFPGLWLKPEHLWKCDLGGIFRIVRRGLGSPEHKAFVGKLSGQKQ